MLLGFDIGGTKSTVVIGKEGLDGGIEIIDKELMPTNLPVGPMIELLLVTAENLLFKNSTSADQFDGIGISCGGPLNSKKGLILSPPNLPGWDNIPIVELINNRFKIKPLLQNDANACAVAEWKYGAGKGYNSLIFLTFGTGMGAGLILDGKLYSGISNLAGEVGHIRLSDMGPVGFGKAGSFEGYCSGGGIAQLAQIKALEKLQMGVKLSFCSGFEDLPKITAKSVAEAAKNGDEVALNVYKICAEYLGKALAIFIDILNPEIIILGSIYERARPLLEPILLDVIQREALADSKDACLIVPAGLSENIGNIAALSLALISKESR
ncbi:MAG TPA: ROK family protein [Hanamia sp.]|nr:ROK family protein [Hanamia sp.]